MKKVETDENSLKAILTSTPLLRITKIILLETKAFPIIYRDYETAEEEKKDSQQFFLSAFLTAISMFVEETSQCALSDIGIGLERYYVKGQGNLISCVVIKGKSISEFPFELANTMAEEVNNRIFEAYALIQSLKNCKSVGNDIKRPTESASIDEMMENFNSVVDDIVMEELMGQFEETKEVIIQQALSRMREEVVYLDPSFKEQGQKVKLALLRTLIKILSSNDESEES